MLHFFFSFPFYAIFFPFSVYSSLFPTFSFFLVFFFGFSFFTFLYSVPSLFLFSPCFYILLIFFPFFHIIFLFIFFPFILFFFELNKSELCLIIVWICNINERKSIFFVFFLCSNFNLIFRFCSLVSVLIFSYFLFFISFVLDIFHFFLPIFSLSFFYII